MGIRSWNACAIFFAAVSVSSLAGCCDHGEGTRALVDHQAWTVLSDSEDPYLSRKPAEVNCTPESIGFEDFNGEPSFAVISSGCSYVTVGQPCRTNACPGENVHLRLWHFQLTNPEPAEAYVAVAIDGKTIWEETIPIPSSSGLAIPYLPLEAELAEGTPIAFHLQNHGINTWNLIELSAGGSPP